MLRGRNLRRKSGEIRSDCKLCHRSGYRIIAAMRLLARSVMDFFRSGLPHDPGIRHAPFNFAGVDAYVYDTDVTEFGKQTPTRGNR